MKGFKSRKVKSPSRGTKASAGLDFFIPEDLPWTSKALSPNEAVLIPSGIHLNIPDGTMLVALEKSGLALKGCSVGARVVDSDYMGEIHIHVYNHSTTPLVLRAGEKVTQFVLVPIIIESIEWEADLSKVYAKDTERGVGGFGSTGLK